MTDRDKQEYLHEWARYFKGEGPIPAVPITTLNTKEDEE